MQYDAPEMKLRIIIKSLVAWKHKNESMIYKKIKYIIIGKYAGVYVSWFHYLQRSKSQLSLQVFPFSSL